VVAEEETDEVERETTL